MAPDAIIFGLANPTPEVHPDVAHKYARVVATGRSDYPNQINNVLAFPGIFRGAFDVHASAITENMKLAAADALADLVGDDLAEDLIIPSPFDPRVPAPSRSRGPGRPRATGSPAAGAGHRSRAGPWRTATCRSRHRRTPRRCDVRGGPIGRWPSSTEVDLRVGSITKTFTSLLLADGVVRGDWTLATPVRDSPRGASRPVADAVEITLEHLATHAAGGAHPDRGPAPCEMLRGLRCPRRTPPDGDSARAHDGAAARSGAPCTVEESDGWSRRSGWPGPRRRPVGWRRRSRRGRRSQPALLVCRPGPLPRTRLPGLAKRPRVLMSRWIRSPGTART